MNSGCPIFEATDNPIECGAEWSLVVNVGSYKPITATAKTTPIQCTVYNHGFTTGQTKIVAGCQDPAANLITTITVVDANTFTLDNTVGTQAGNGGVVITPDNLTGYTTDFAFRATAFTSEVSPQPTVSVSNASQGEITISYTHTQTASFQSTPKSLIGDMFVLSGGNRYKKFTVTVPIKPAITT